MVDFYFNISVFCERIGGYLTIYLQDFFLMKLLIMQELYCYYYNVD